MKKLIAPSLLAADFSQLGKEVEAVTKAGADVIHVDIMDGHFVPNLTMGPAIVKAIKPYTSLPLDCHLMINNPGDFIEPFANAGADWISIHIETGDVAKHLAHIQRMKKKAGLVINPPTPLEAMLKYVHLADFVLVMTVNPGFGGQALIEHCLEKISQLKRFREEKKLNFQIEVDGGVKLENIAQVSNAGAEIIVSGSGIFSHNNYKEIISEMKASL